MQQPGHVVVCAVGLKGVAFVEGLLGIGIKIDSIATYRQADDRSRGFERLRDLAALKEIELLETREPRVQPGNLTFLVGWQHRLPVVTPTTVVFHDSLLPRYRGFAPTVTALIKGDPEIGVTALRPVDVIDAGPIIAQRAVPISYPMKIQAALQLQAGLMIDMAAGIVDSWRRGELSATSQREDMATYSIWRDSEDYEIDWSNSAEAIARFVNAVGYPYAGARTTVGGTETARIFEVTAIPDLAFEIREPGKIWRLDDGHPIVICGTGMVRIDDCRHEDGSTFSFRRLRLRLGPAK